MAFTVDNLIQDGSFEVILKSDPAIEGISDEEYAAYARSLDESLLRVASGQEPTRWKMTKKLKYAHKQWVDAAKIEINKAGELQVKINEFMVREVRASLEAIISPSSVPEDKRLESKFKKTGDGLVTEDFTVALGSLVEELFLVRQIYLETQKTGKASLKK